MIYLENERDSLRMREFAKFCIHKYFSHMGISEDRYSDPKYLEMCVSTDVCSGMDRAYRAMEKSGRFADEDSSHPIERDIRWVVKTLASMSRIIPKEFSAGILLMHLEIIEGVPV
jgi:hypothetical protein